MSRYHFHIYIRRKISITIYLLLKIGMVLIPGSYKILHSACPVLCRVFAAVDLKGNHERLTLFFFAKVISTKLVVYCAFFQSKDLVLDLADIQ